MPPEAEVVGSTASIGVGSTKKETTDLYFY